MSQSQTDDLIAIRLLSKLRTAGDFRVENKNGVLMIEGAGIKYDGSFKPFAEAVVEASLLIMAKQMEPK